MLPDFECGIEPLRPFYSICHGGLKKNYVKLQVCACISDNGCSVSNELEMLISNLGSDRIQFQEKINYHLTRINIT